MKHIYPMRSPAENAKQGLPLETLRAYEAGQMNADEIVSLGQNIYEAGLLPKLPPRYFLLLEHLKRCFLVHTHGRAMH